MEINFFLYDENYDDHKPEILKKISDREER